MIKGTGIPTLIGFLITFYSINKTDINNNSTLKTMNAVTKNQVYEMALYSIKDEATDIFPKLSRKTINYLSTFRGYISSVTYHSISDPNLYLDVVLWESLDDALAAQKKFESDPKVADYLMAIDTIKFFDHAKVISKNGVLKFNDLDENDVLEFATIYINDNSLEQLLANREPLMNYIGNQYQEFKEVKTMQSVKEQDLVIDIARWGNVESCSLAQQQIESHELFVNFAGSFNMEKGMIMEFFTKLK